MNIIKLRSGKMYKLYVRRNPCEKWSYWSHANTLETLVANVQVIEKYGWQWKVMGDE